uniref:NADH-ubiquinone oxidoreductase chain 3 n=1 Tax=Plectus acuminatus TaxID=70689 RepID=A0A1U7AFR9_PLEAC|nr:NADH dehydrogenase subunit 3 [Plectus acuminatus]
MFYLFMVFALVVALIAVLHFLLFLLSFAKSSNNKLSSFESGFTSVGMSQKSFSLQFFLLMVVFIIFDIEVVLLLGFVVKDFWSSVGMMMVIAFILGGLFLEWKTGKLIWMF